MMTHASGGEFCCERKSPGYGEDPEKFREMTSLETGVVGGKNVQRRNNH